ncbi:MAG: DUF3987 domain-containing protein, partial [Nitrospinota bacterium]|nr:DUF3987 domain-containing protein [Nitrospinota bacterium]
MTSSTTPIKTKYTSDFITEEVKMMARKQAYIPGEKLAGIYPYVDGDGEVFFRIRIEGPGEKDKRFTILHKTGAIWESKEPKIENGKPLFLLPELYVADPKESVFIVEGEKCAETLTALGLVATTSGGSTSANGADWSPLKDRHCIIWPDNDESGQRYAEAVATKLEGLAASVRVIDVGKLGLPEKGDCVDWLSKNRSAMEEDILALDCLEVPDLNSSEWPQPQPLVASIEPKPFPVEALPKTIQAAVMEVQGFVKAPMPLVASSALGVASLVTQAHFDIERDVKLKGPIGLYLLTIAESGERKSTVDKYYMTSVHEWEKEQSAKATKEYEEYESAQAAWEARHKGLLDRIRKNKRNGSKSASKDKKDESPSDSSFSGVDLSGILSPEDIELEELKRTKPKAPIIPRLLHNNATTEALIRNLAKGWPSGGMITSEAGTVFGGHSMKAEGIKANLAQLNLLWDGAPVSSERITTDEYSAYGIRFTVCLAVQPAVLQNFHDDNAELARGSGFWARFLLSWPESTQGIRFYVEPPIDTPALSNFNKRIADIVAAELPLDDTGNLSPKLLTLSPQAKAKWIDFHDSVETELGVGGQLADVRDVASKVADNAARLAALFEVFENGLQINEVSMDSMSRAIQIVSWHLHEARRFFGELAQPAETVEAAKLGDFLLNICKANEVNSVSRRDIQQRGPQRLREKI